jgi:hypothetical protein
MPATKKKLTAAKQRSAERALREERQALLAITKVMLLEVRDPSRVLARLDAMARAARDPVQQRLILDATRFVRAAVAQELGKAQPLFDPHVGHVRPEKVDALVEPTEGEQQLGLDGQGSFLGDVEQEHTERVATIGRVHDAIVELIREHGAADDRLLHSRYLVKAVGGGLPTQSAGAIRERRQELSAAGRLVSAGSGTWDLVERAS